jgi:hypothetical protein
MKIVKSAATGDILDTFDEIVSVGETSVTLDGGAGVLTQEYGEKIIVEDTDSESGG